MATTPSTRRATSTTWFIFPNEKNKEKIAFLESVWEVNWVSLLPLALDKSMRFLMQIAVSATLQVPDELLRPGIWCKSKEMETKLSVFIPSTERGEETDA